MKFTLALSFLAGLVYSKEVAIEQDSSVYVPHQYRNLQATNGALALPTQTYFVPIPDQMLYDQIIFKLNAEPYIRETPVTHILAITVSTDNTVIWFDHWEDGYDQDVTVAMANTTVVWGDGKKSNGCAPFVAVCTDAADVLKAGNNILLRNNIPIPRNKNNRFVDGGDRIQASFPVTVTRAGHPHRTAVLASAIQALDTSQWGTTYEAPVGVDFGKNFYNQSYEWVIMIYQAGANFTTVTLPNLSNVTLNMGESGFYVVNQGDQITSDKPIQVILVTGDIDLATKESKPETRWFGIRSVQQMTNSYITPVGDTIGKSRMLIYNPNSDNIQYNMKYLNNSVLTTFTGTVNSKKAVYSPVIPYNSGAIFESTYEFMALSITDTEQYNSKGVQTWAATYDWGFAATPTNLLTPEVLIGLGWGCLNNICPQSPIKTSSRSVVWVTPTETADIYVDYRNNGTAVVSPNTPFLKSLRFADAADHDMTGAAIFATKPGTGKEGTPVDISVAWGQDPTLALLFDWENTMDMGTVVLPLSVVNVAKLVDKSTVKDGEELEYTIRITNSGQKTVQANTLQIVDTLDAEVQYVAGSTVMVTKAGAVSAVLDSAGGTPFPFDGLGYPVPIILARRGSYIDFVFKVKVAAKFSGQKDAIVNKGILKKLYDKSETTFEAISTIDFTPAVKVDNTVAHGTDELMCQFGEDSVAGRNGTDVVYCFNITNTGTSYLSSISIANAALIYTNSTTLSLAPGESTMIAVVSKIAANLTNTVIVTAKPTLADGTAILGKDDVNASDPSSVLMKVGLEGNVKQGDVIPVGKCMEDNWKLSGKTDSLVCASKEIYIESLTAKEATTCVPGETIVVSVDASIILTGERSDVGWYVASDGGDALVGTCFTSGLQNFGTGYDVVDVATGASTVGTVKWTTRAGTDECGDVALTKGNTAAKMAIALLSEAAILCADDNDDGVMDFAICFNWKSTSDLSCSLSMNIPGNNRGCFCTRVDIPNVEVVKTVTNVKAC